MKYVGSCYMKGLAWVSNCMSYQGALGSLIECWLKCTSCGRTQNTNHGSMARRRLCDNQRYDFGPS